jgi:phosphoserine phosphatase RsbU/P
MFDSDPPTVVHALNRALLRANTDRFTTAVFMRLHPRPELDEALIRVASGGHPPVLIQRADGSIEESTAAGQLLGVSDFAPEDLRVADYRLSRGDVLVLYTDGLTEARRAGALFDIDGVKATLTRLSGAAPSQLADALIDAALEHAGAPLRDDVAIVVLRVTGR